MVTGALSAAFSRRHGLIAISKTATTLTVAVHDPLAPFPDSDIKSVTGLDIERVVATRSDIEAVTKSFYDLRTSLKTAEKQLSAGRLPGFDLGNQEYLSAQSDELDPAAAPVVKALDHLLNYAFEQRASDIHFEPKRLVTLVRLRIDGMLHDVHVVPRIVYQAIVSRIKLLSGCNLAEKRRPQDGRIKREQGGREIELRVSTMPTAFGEKAVLRIFDPDVVLNRVDQLGFSPPDLVLFEELLARTHGIILVTGPTGSGKTTTLYSVLKQLSKPEVNIVTIEDPIEMVHEDFNQVAVRPAIDLTFAAALRTVLRQDPDIIMVGEIRDTETRRERGAGGTHRPPRAVHAHTNDAPSAITRLLDLKVPHFLCPVHARRDRRATAGARELSALQRGVPADSRGIRDTRRGDRGPDAAPRQGMPPLPADRLRRPGRRFPDHAPQRTTPWHGRASGHRPRHRRRCTARGNADAP